MKGHGSKFERKKREAIAALLAKRTIPEAAESIDVSKQTLLRWMKIPEFHKALWEAGRAAMSHSNARLQQATSAAVSVLTKIMIDAAHPAPARVRAAEPGSTNGSRRAPSEHRVKPVKAGPRDPQIHIPSSPRLLAENGANRLEARPGRHSGISLIGKAGVP